MDRDTSLKLTSEIVVAYLSRNSLSRSEVALLIAEVREALDGSSNLPGLIVRQQSSVQASDPNPDGDAEVQEAAVATPLQMRSPPALDLVPALDKEDAPPPKPKQKLKPAVPVGQSIHDDYLINLEDGKRYRSLRRHLMARYGMTPDDYRRKWGLPDDYPMVAPSYARERSEVAKKSGLGRASTVRRNSGGR